VPDCDGGSSSDSAIVDAALEKAEAPKPLPTPADAVAACTVSGMGFIECNLEPFNLCPTVGRVRDFPQDKSKLPADRRATIVCHMHDRRCAPPPFRRGTISQQDVLTWLFSSSYPNADGSHRRVGNSVAHTKLFARFVHGGGEGSGAAPATGSGAASSTDVI
jgi:hypothetical protein